MALNVKYYQLGYRHGNCGIRHLAHRKGDPYPTINKQEAYTAGYKAGAKHRRDTKRGGLNYKHRLNNQQFR